MLPTLRKFLITALALTGICSAQAQEATSMDNPITKAVMDSYSKMLAENPNDYKVLFRRANEYYNHNRYADALTDINRAIDLVPAKEKDQRFQCYSLRASIYERTKNYAQAVSDYKNALTLDPNSYAITYQKANTEFEMGDYEAAKTDYQRLQRLNPRSQEALFGLASVAAKSGNTAQATRYLDDAVALAPHNPESYINRASVLRMMGNNQSAVDDYIVSLSMADGADMGRALNALVQMSDTHYSEVIGALSSAISRSPRQGIYYYLRGVIAQNHYRYTSAITDYDYIIQNYLLDYPRIYRQLAECQYALCLFDEALENIDTAIGSTADNIESYVVKSDIKRAMEVYTQAVTAADRALNKQPDYAPALLAKGLAQIGAGLLTEASVSLGKAVTAEPNDPYYSLVRAWSLRKYFEMPDQADSYCEAVLKMDTYPATDVRSLRGFALLQTGRADEAKAWMAEVLQAAADRTDGEVQYYAACLYAQAGDTEQALSYTEQALGKGYANLYNWTRADEGGISVAPLRGNARFDALIAAHSHLFKK